ncbi:MAG: MltA domain-containing protein [Smithella sp.]
MRYSLKIFLFMVLVALLNGCVHAVPETAVKHHETFVPVVADDMDFSDDLDRESLESAIERSINFYEKAGLPKVFNINGQTINTQEFKETLIAFRDILRRADNQADFRKRIAGKFRIYRTTGSNEEGSVLFTGYYEPLLEGSLERTGKFRYPVYRVPPDLIKNQNQIGRMDGGKFVSYYSRREIDVEGVLQGRDLELAWVSDPLELFSLHIQGSGKVKLENGNILSVGFAQTNGRPFRSVTKFMLEGGRINSSEANYRHDFLKGKIDQEIYNILSHNERYTFFRFLETDPVGSLGEPVTPGRSIATDPDFFPEGALAFIRLNKPVFDDDGKFKAKVNFSRFVLNQDKGAAIKGPGRVDLFCGFGEQAENTAGTLKEKGTLYLLLRK